MATFRGKQLTITIYGESHAPMVGAHVTGMPAFAIDQAALLRFMARRRATGQPYATARAEADMPTFVGTAEGHTTSDFDIQIHNDNVRSTDYAQQYGKPRPAHADYAWHCKDGTLDFAGGGRFSARLTAPFAAVGGLCKQYLHAKGVDVYAYIASIGGVCGPSYKHADFPYAQLPEVADYPFPALGEASAMQAEIAAAKAALDSVGGTVECVVTGLPAGLGDNLFEGLEGKIASLVYAIPAVKGVEFGAGFGIAAMRGSTANDPLYYNEQGKVCFASNHAGGINGGISNGNVITLAVAFRPTPSIAQLQQTIDLTTRTNTTIAVRGRHDACVVPRAVPVVESAVAIALLDEWMSVPQNNK